jgi:2-iminobutanoate/2-iminopropanoate deaminase
MCRSFKQNLECCTKTVPQAKNYSMKKLIYALTFLLLTIAPAAAQQLQKINPPGLSKPAPGTYTHIVRSGKMLFIAGQTPINASGQVIGSTMKEQLEQVMANLLVALKSQGADFSHVTKTTTFVTSISEFRTPEVAAVRTKYVGTNPPANTLVQIQQLADPAYKVEIEAIAILP